MTIAALLLIIAGPILVIGSYFIRSTNYHVIVNVLGFIILISIVLMVLNDSITGAYEAKYRRDENKNHYDIMILINDKLNSGQIDTAKGILNDYKVQIASDAFTGNALLKVLANANATPITQ